jgi:hypothetical protein
MESTDFSYSLRA